MNRRERRASTRNSRKASESALQAFDKAVQLKPDDVRNWKNLANFLFELPSASANEAMAAYRKVLSLDPRDWEAACRLGYLHFRSGQLEDALACFGLCDTLQPNHAPTLRMKSGFLFDLKRYEQAAAEGMRAYALDPTDVAICNTIGSALNALNHHEEALPWFDRALSLAPAHDKVLYNKALALAKLNRVDEAIAIREQLKAKLSTDSPDVSGARLLFDLGCCEDALAMLNLCLEKRPDEVAALELRALCLSKLKQFERSLADSRRAHLLDPASPYSCNGIGAMLLELGRYSEALPWFEKAVDLRPDYVEGLNNVALTLYHLHRLVEAVDTYTRSRAIDPSNPSTVQDMAYARLLGGDFEAGWACREARWAVPGLPIVYPKFSQPMWLGESDIAGKTILIYSDEGLGDAIQFVRYMPMVAARGARVILAVQSSLVPLLSGVDGVSLCVARDPVEALPAFDIYCPMMSLPLAFHTRLDTIPSGISYLPAPPEDRVCFWRDRLPSHNKPRVGLVWSGNPNHRGDRYRSIPLREFARILEVDATFVSLQKDLRPDDKAVLDESCIFDPTEDLTDFGETAALLDCLDLVIAVDTSVAHLAGALGRPTWLLLPYTPDYRWLLDRDDSPWYPTVRLFRQSERQDWTEVIERVRCELAVRSASVPAS